MWQTAPMAAGGMGRPEDRLRATSRRARATRSRCAAQQRPDDGKPCWVVVGPARAEGTIHAWWRDEGSGQWHALVIAWLPAESVSRRT